MTTEAIQFTPLKDFYSAEFRSYYCLGLSYTARPEDAKLRELLPTWIKGGLVRLGTPAAKVAGIGTVE